MKILHLLAVSTIVNASQTIEENKDDTLNMNLNSLQDELRSLSNTDSILLHSQESNHKEIETISSNAIGNPITTEDKEIDEILDTLFFNFLKQAVSFYLYNISTLRPIFIDIHNKRTEGKIDIKAIEKILYRHASIFKIIVLTKLFDAEKNANTTQLEDLTRFCKGYLSIRGIPCENLSYTELKNEILISDSRFFITEAKLNFKYKKLKLELREITGDHFGFDEHSMSILLGFSNLIDDLSLIFVKAHRLSLNVKLLPALKTNSMLFDWIIDTMANISNAPIFKSFLNETFHSLTFDYPNLQIISGFILTLFKIVQASQRNRFFSYNPFPLVNEFSSKLL